jgi:hypothetical protein
LSQRIPPHERTFLYELSEERKRSLVHLPSTEKNEMPKSHTSSSAAGTRSIVAIPKDSPTLRAYLANMGQLERQLLNEAIIARGIELLGTESEPRNNPLTITAARALLPETLQREIRLRARNLAWQSLVPEETMARNPLPEAVRISDTIAHLQEELQDKASLAQHAQNDFVATKMRERANASPQLKSEAGSRQTRETRKQFQQEVIASLSAAEARQWKGLESFAWQRREDVYRAFALLDAQFQELELTRVEKLPQENLRHIPPMPPQGLSRNEMRVRQERNVDPSHQHRTLLTQFSSESSEPIWHFDSLQEVLRQKINNLPSGTANHTIDLPPKTQDQITVER